MVALIVEDGSIVANANSYNSVADIRNYASDRGITLPIENDTVASFAISAMDWLRQNDNKWKGEIVSTIQTLAWPRKNVIIGYTVLPSDKIPTQIKSAQCQLCVYASQGILLTPATHTEKFLKREKLGPLEQEYSETLAKYFGTLPGFPFVDSLISDLLRSGGAAIRTVRI